MKGMKGFPLINAADLAARAEGLDCRGNCGIIVRTVWVQLFVMTFLLTHVCTPLRAQEAWYPSKYGANDTIGAANNLSADIVLQAAKLITKGKVYSLAIVSGPDLMIKAVDSGKRDVRVIVVKRGPLGSNRVVVNDNMVIGWPAVGTEIDGLGHAGIDNQFYNGNHLDEVYTTDGLKKLGTEQVPPIVTRGVLIDIARYYGVDMVKGGTAFNRAELEGAMKQQGIEVRKGDVVLLHTGWLALLPAEIEKFMATWPGLGKEGASYLAEKGVVAVGADTNGVEVVPFEVKGEFGPVHQILLAKNGVYILEFIDTRQLAAEGVNEFLFVLGVPRIKGGVKGFANPIAIR